MEDITGSRTEGSHLAQGHQAGESSKPMLSLVSESPADSSHVENGFFEKGTAEDKAAMAMYAAMLPRGNLGRISPRTLMLAGAAVLLLVGLATGRHLPGGHSSAAVTAPPAENPAVVAPAPLAAQPAAPAPAPAAIAPVPAAPTAQVVAEPPAAALPSPAPAEPVADQEIPAPAVAAIATAQPAAKPEEPPAPARDEPSAAPVPAQAQIVQACREAIKRRDGKAITANCESAIAADSSLAKPLLGFAKAQFEKGKSAQAAVWARKIVQVNSSLADAYLIMGAAEQEAHHTAAAKSAYQRYLELAPKGPYADDVRSSLRSL